MPDLPRPANWQVFTIVIPCTTGLLADPEASPAFCRSYFWPAVRQGQEAAAAEFARLDALEVGAWEWEARPVLPGPLEALAEAWEVSLDLPVVIVGACEVRLPDGVAPPLRPPSQAWEG
jgi:hypothetical protein